MRGNPWLSRNECCEEREGQKGHRMWRKAGVTTKGYRLRYKLDL